MSVHVTLPFDIDNDGIPWSTSQIWRTLHVMLDQLKSVGNRSQNSICVAKAAQGVLIRFRYLCGPAYAGLSLRRAKRKTIRV